MRKSLEQDHDHFYKRSENCVHGSKGEWRLTSRSRVKAQFELWQRMILLNTGYIPRGLEAPQGEVEELLPSYHDEGLAWIYTCKILV